MAEAEEEAREKIMKRFEKIGLTLMNRTRGSADFHGDPIASVLGDPYKRALAAQILGQAYVIAYNFVLANKDAVERVAEKLVDQRRALRRRAARPTRRTEPDAAESRLHEGRDVAEDVSGAPEPEPDSEPESTESAPQLPATSTVVDAEPARPVGGVTVRSRADRARHSAYRSRFVLFYFGLAIVAGSAVGAFVVVLSRPHAKPPPPWSTFVPSGSDDARVKQIASHVGKEYKLPSGERLVAVLSGHPTQTVLTSASTAAQVSVVAVAVRPDTWPARTRRATSSSCPAPPRSSTRSAASGTNCTITKGKPSTQRHALLRREAIELALYTFKYVPATKAVVAFLPPPPGVSSSGQPNSATSVFLDRKACSRTALSSSAEDAGPRDADDRTDVET